MGGNIEQTAEKETVSVDLLTQLLQWNLHIQLPADQLNCFYTSTDESRK